jgi:hypothetical protein
MDNFQNKYRMLRLVEMPETLKLSVAFCKFLIIFNYLRTLLNSISLYPVTMSYSLEKNSLNDSETPAETFHYCFSQMGISATLFLGVATTESRLKQGFSGMNILKE